MAGIDPSADPLASEPWTLAPQSRRLAAYHEAGHAVVGYLYDSPIRRVFLKPPAPGRTRWEGETHDATLDPDLLASQEWMTADDPRREANAIIAMAGAVSEWIYGAYVGDKAIQDDADLGAGTDLCIADLSLAPQKATHATYGRWRGRELAKALLVDAQVWATLETLAAALETELGVGGDPLNKLLQPLSHRVQKVMYVGPTR